MTQRDLLNLAVIKVASESKTQVGYASLCDREKEMKEKQKNAAGVTGRDIGLITCTREK
ncbi:MAG TPA: hypothetical protein VMW34_01485 [Anaerolineales bacterium]|jgi:hypothetical protein|nr:hypothetical protein [Anaerolineales bacterium]